MSEVTRNNELALSGHPNYPNMNPHLNNYVCQNALMAMVTQSCAVDTNITDTELTGTACSCKLN